MAQRSLLFFRLSHTDFRQRSCVGTVTKVARRLKCRRTTIAVMTSRGHDLLRPTCQQGVCRGPGSSWSLDISKRRPHLIFKASRPISVCQADVAVQPWFRNKAIFRRCKVQDIWDIAWAVCRRSPTAGDLSRLQPQPPPVQARHQSSHPLNIKP